jgi:hypothetical protein
MLGSWYHMHGCHVYRDRQVVATINTDLPDWREIVKAISVTPDMMRHVDVALSLLDKLEGNDDDTV